MSYDVSLVSTQTTLPTTAVGSGTSASTAAAESAQEEKDMFLQILLTSLEHQNPLDPVDTTEYTSQLAQYSALEQQIDTNTHLEEIKDLLSSSTTFTPSSYVGAEVSVNDDTTVVQNDLANWSYALSGAAETVTLTLTDENGDVLQEISLENETEGTYELSINAAELGVSNGSLINLTVTAKNSEGGTVSTQTSAQMRVETVETDGSGEITLQAGDYTFSADLVTSYKQSS